MQRIPYTYDQAQTLCKKLQGYVGNSFDEATGIYGRIECIAISPFDQVNKKKFLFYYLLSGSAEQALREEYKGLLYDVVVIARSVSDTNELVQEDVNTWMVKHNITPELLSEGTGSGEIKETISVYNLQ